MRLQPGGVTTLQGRSWIGLSESNLLSQHHLYQNRTNTKNRIYIKHFIILSCALGEVVMKFVGTKI